LESTKIPKLTKKTFRHALQYLGGIDRDLAQVLDRYGPPPINLRKPGFPTLVQIILEQQVSLASAKAAFTRLLTSSSPLTPSNFLKLDDDTLLKIGFSRQKTLYCRQLSQTIMSNDLNLAELKNLNDLTVRKRLMMVKGIGPWTADIYLLMALGRPDIWPGKDLALVSALQDLKGLSKPADLAVFEHLSDAWRPWRAVAARILWHFYLNR
jgi:DNA-3-methyladenine glycosylase II